MKTTDTFAEQDNVLSKRLKKILETRFEDDEVSRFDLLISTFNIIELKW